MTDNEITKALECCCCVEKGGCLVCPLWGGYLGVIHTVDCKCDLHKAALGLINRQKAEIERLANEARLREKDQKAKPAGNLYKIELLSSITEKPCTPSLKGVAIIKAQDAIHFAKLYPVKLKEKGRSNP